MDSVSKVLAMEAQRLRSSEISCKNPGVAVSTTNPRTGELETKDH